MSKAALMIATMAAMSTPTGGFNFKPYPEREPKNKYNLNPEEVEQLEIMTPKQKKKFLKAKGKSGGGVSMSECEIEPDAPKGYNEWHAWAENKLKTHKNTQCKKCGLWHIWTKIRRCKVCNLELKPFVACPCRPRY